MTDVRENCRRVLDKIRAAALGCGRDPQSIRLIAVTKKVPVERIREAVEAGIDHVGESRLQEALPKRDALRNLPLTWHFIGHLQTNKAKKVAESFDWIQSVDRVELAGKLNDTAPRRIPILVEVKLHEEPNKTGVEESSVQRLVEHLVRYDRLQVRGLMAIPPFFDDPEDTRPYFRKLRQLAAELGLQEVSMGMSHDYEVAVQEGATMVRVGSALFGERQ